MARTRNIQDVAGLIHRAPEIEALPEDGDEDLIYMPEIGGPTMLRAQVPTKGGTDCATPQWDRLVGICNATLGDNACDIPEAEGKPMIESRSVTDDLGWEAVASIQGFHRPSVPN